MTRQVKKAKEPGMTKFDISESLLKKLSKLIEDVGLTEIEYEEDGRRLRLTKQPPTSFVTAPTVLPESQPAAGMAESATPAQNAPPAPAQGAIDGFVVEAAMVGTAYSAPEPGKPPFISVGDQISEGQTILIIEAMKFMNQVPSPRAGVVKEILFQDGDAIEFGQALVVLGD